ncbi:MAG: thioredoxin [Archangium gephyra]|uniref:Thioredoxin n=1 Tax=Archangium gephyra TaxID=48 RepID=A0A2W5SW48_9BACT|nr:MAG: thioredoxin [Archangium gephyra]
MSRMRRRRSFTRQYPVATTTRTVAHLLAKSLMVASVLVSTAALAQNDPAQVLSGVPGFDFSRLTAPAKKELASVLTDEFDYCGRPMTLLGSLKKGDACKHTRRLVGHAGSLAAEGVAATEIIVSLSKYNQGFNKPRASLKPDDRQCMGNKDAKVTIVEFSDFECPYCAAARPILEEYVKQKSNVRLCMMPFPLQQHPNAMFAGQAALFARDAGKFWQVHDALFDNQLSLSEDFIKNLLTKNGLDVKAFLKAVDAKKYVDELEASKEAGRKAGVDSTPSIYVNGRKYTLNLSTESLNLAVDDEQDWLSGNSAWPSN